MKKNILVLMLMASSAVSCAKKNEATDVKDPVAVDQGDKDKDKDKVQPQPPAEVLIEAGQFATAGSGCSGSGLAKVTADEIIFETSTDAIKAAGLVRKNCTMVLPIKVPAGKKLVIDSASMNSEVKLVQGLEASVRAEVFFAGETGEILSQEYSAQGPDELIANNQLVTVKSLEAKCEQAVNLRANVSLLLKGASSAPTSLAHASGISFKYSLKSCP
jgi:Domain of unknown function (DUF4360)